MICKWFGELLNPYLFATKEFSNDRIQAKSQNEIIKPRKIYISYLSQLNVILCELDIPKIIDPNSTSTPLPATTNSFLATVETRPFNPMAYTNLELIDWQTEEMRVNGPKSEFRK